MLLDELAIEFSVIANPRPSQVRRSNSCEVRSGSCATSFSSQPACAPAARAVPADNPVPPSAPRTMGLLDKVAPLAAARTTTWHNAAAQIVRISPLSRSLRIRWFNRFTPEISDQSIQHSTEPPENSRFSRMTPASAIFQTRLGTQPSRAGAAGQAASSGDPIVFT
jgi:hypothetical protein